MAINGDGFKDCSLRAADCYKYNKYNDICSEWKSRATEQQKNQIMYDCTRIDGDHFNSTCAEWTDATMEAGKQ